MKRTVLSIGLSLAALVGGGCGSGSVPAEDVKPYQQAGLPPGEKVQTATPLPGDAKAGGDRPAGEDR